MDGSPSALREAPPAAVCRFHTANFTYIVLSSSSFVDQLSSANAIDASVRRGDGEGGVRSENWARTTSYAVVLGSFFHFGYYESSAPPPILLGKF